MKSITSDQLSQVFGGDLSLDDGEYECEGVPVVAFEGGLLDRLACDESCHGVHPRYADVFGSLHAKYKEIFKTKPPGECGKCGGTGWLQASSDVGRTVLLLSATIGIYRGVTVRASPVSQEDLSRIWDQVKESSK